MIEQILDINERLQHRENWTPELIYVHVTRFALGYALGTITGMLIGLLIFILRSI